MNTASRRRCGDISTLLSETISIRFIAISQRTKIPLHHKLAKRWRGDEWHGKGKRRLHGRGRDHDLRARDPRQRLHLAPPAAGRCLVGEPDGQRTDGGGDHRGPHPASALDPARSRHHPGHRERVPGQVGRGSGMAGGVPGGRTPRPRLSFRAEYGPTHRRCRLFRVDGRDRPCDGLRDVHLREPSPDIRVHPAQVRQRGAHHRGSDFNRTCDGLSVREGNRDMNRVLRSSMMASAFLIPVVLAILLSPVSADTQDYFPDTETAVKGTVGGAAFPGAIPTSADSYRTPQEANPALTTDLTADSETLTKANSVSGTITSLNVDDGTARVVSEANQGTAGVETSLYPDADGTYDSGWQSENAGCVAGTHWQCVEEVWAPDDATSYVISTTTLSDKESNTVADLSITAGVTDIDER